MAFRRWFPRSVTKQAAFYSNFTRVFKENAAELGFSAETVEKLEADNAVMQYLAHTEFGVKAFRKAFSELRKNLTLGMGNKTPIYMQFIPFEEPPIVPYGMFERLFKLADRITAADGYTDVIGAQLGILPKSDEALKISDLILKLKGKPLGDAKAEIRFKRGKSSGVNLFFRRLGNEQLHDLGRYFKSPVIIKIPLLEAGKPEQVYVCGQYLDGNTAVGNFSASIELLVKP